MALQYTILRVDQFAGACEPCGHDRRSRTQSNTNDRQVVMGTVIGRRPAGVVLDAKAVPAWRPRAGV